MSLTPNEDAVRLSLGARAGLPVGRETPVGYEPGAHGVSVRLQLAIGEARALAVARELDRATPHEKIVDGFVTALASEIIAMSIGFSDDPAAFGSCLIRRIALKAGIIGGLVASGAVAVDQTPIVAIARA